MRRWAFFAAGLLLCGAASASTRLDDSLSPRQRVEATAHWLYDGAGDWNEDQINALVADVSAMEFRLRTAPYVGKNAEIYLAIPQHVKGLTTPTALRVEWTTRGTFSPGSVVPGQRERPGLFSCHEEAALVLDRAGVAAGIRGDRGDRQWGRTADPADRQHRRHGEPGELHRARRERRQRRGGGERQRDAGKPHMPRE
jgi:hypothetical protein